VNQFVGRNDVPESATTLIDRVALDAKRQYGQDVDPALLERYARLAVETLCTESTRVRSFVPVLAMRQIRDMLSTTGDSQVGAGGSEK